MMAERGDKGGKKESSKPRRGAGLLVLVLLGVLLGILDFAFTGIWIIKRNEQGIVLRFGRISRICTPGMQFTLPYPFETVERVQTTAIRSMSIGFRVAEKMRGIPPTASEVQWLTGDTNIVNIQADVKFMVDDVATYVYRVEPQKRNEPRDVIVRYIAEGVMTELVARMAVDEVLSIGKLRLQEESQEEMQAVFDEMKLGLRVVSVNVVEGNPPLAVQSAFVDVSSAKADRERMITEAKGYRDDILPKARSRSNAILQDAEVYRDDVVSEARGKAERFLSLAEKVSALPAISRKRLWLDALERTLARPHKIIYPRVPGEKFKLTEVK